MTAVIEDRDRDNPVVFLRLRFAGRRHAAAVLEREAGLGFHRIATSMVPIGLFELLKRRCDRIALAAARPRGRTTCLSGGLDIELFQLADLRAVVHREAVAEVEQ